MEWVVIPLHTARARGCSCGSDNCSSPAKHPRTERGLKNASADIATVARWWREWPEANVGIVTGKVSGLEVLDIDVKEGRNGALTLEFLEHQHGNLPKTVGSVTRSGGRHIFFRHPRASEIRNRTAIRPRLDVRADGGSVVARLLNEVVDAFEVAKSEVPDIANDGIILARAEAKVVPRRLQNIAKAIGDPAS